MKGFFSKNLELFIGLVIVIFILLITFKLLGMWAAFQYEHEAEKSAKNLQTAMNYVCASPKGVTQVVEINLPQKISPTGSSNPLDFIKGLITRDIEAVSNALRYMTALKSYGDPWYVIYYESFPQGEDSGWSGWSEVAAMRVSSVYAHGISLATCLGMGAIPIIGDLARYGGKVVKAIGKESAREAAEKGAEVVTRSAKWSKFTHKLRLAFYSPEGEEIFLKTIGTNIVKYGKKAGITIKESPVKIYRWMKGYSWINVKAHKDAVKKGFEGINRVVDTLTNTKKYVVKGKDDIDDIFKHIDDLKRADISNTEAKGIIGELSMESKYIDIYKGIGGDIRVLEKGYPNLLSSLSSKERNILRALISKLERGEKISENEYKLVRGILLDENFKPRYYGADKIYERFENAKEIRRFQERMKDIEDKILDDDAPFEYTRLLIGASEEESVSRLDKLAAAYRLNKGFKKEGKVWRAGKRIVTREGTWIGSTLILSNVLSLTKIGKLKFSPCSDHALCLKSQVSPSITIYPLEECEQAGIDYIELEKHPYEGGLGVKVTSWFDSAANWITGLWGEGGKSTSRFYTASPCRGRLRIEKGECRCNYQEVPYFDMSTMDLFNVSCKIESSSGLNIEVKCWVYRKMANVEGAESEYLGYFTESVNVNTDTSGGETIYSFSINLNRIIYDDEGHEEDILTKYGKIDEGEDLKCEPVLPDISVGEKFACDPIILPAYAFDYGICDGSSDLWLECVNWIKIGEGTLKKDNIEGKEIEVPANEWCCLQWNLSYYPGGIHGLKEDSVEIVEVSDCGDYVKKKIRDEIETNIKNVINHYNGKIDIKDPNEYVDEIEEKIINTIRESSKVIVPKETEQGEEIDLTDEDINKIYLYNLPSYSKVDCLKVSYSAKEVDGEKVTKGFCYTSPTGWADLEAGGWFAASLAVDLGIEVLANIVSGGSAAATGAAQVGSCVAGQYVLWYGENLVSETKQKHYWPNNLFFDKYFI